MAETFGAYTVHEEIGVGGMARVHRAERTGEGSQAIALKRMLPHLASNAELVKSFEREARVASYMRHTNVAQTYELGKVDDTWFIAMELVLGHELGEIVKKCSPAKPMPVPIVINIVTQIADALDYAHNLADESGQPLGIIHRDVSPANVIVATGGVVKLIDFGIAKVRSGDMQTMSFSVKGKFGYMAPEYLAGSIDARADIFALGVIAYELLTSAPLFTDAIDIDTLHKLRNLKIEPPSTRNSAVPADLDDVILTALSRDPDARWQQARAMRDAITVVARREGLIATNAQVAEWVAQQFGGTPAAALTTLVDARTPVPSVPAASAIPPAGVWDVDDPDAETRVRPSALSMTPPPATSGLAGPKAAPHDATRLGVQTPYPRPQTGPVMPAGYTRPQTGPVMPEGYVPPPQTGPMPYVGHESGPVPRPSFDPAQFNVSTQPVGRPVSSPSSVLVIAAIAVAGCLAGLVAYFLVV